MTLHLYSKRAAKKWNATEIETNPYRFCSGHSRALCSIMRSDNSILLSQSIAKPFHCPRHNGELTIRFRQLQQTFYEIPQYYFHFHSNLVRKIYINFTKEDLLACFQDLLDFINRRCVFYKLGQQVDILMNITIKTMHIFKIKALTLQLKPQGFYKEKSMWKLPAHKTVEKLLSVPGAYIYKNSTHYYLPDWAYLGQKSG